jgi:hypothetical protein
MTITTAIMMLYEISRRNAEAARKEAERRIGGGMTLGELAKKKPGGIK